MAVEFHFSIRSDVGLVRKSNQDSAYAGPRLLVVADGMGGAAGGDIASSVVIAHLAPLDDAPGPSEELLTNLGDALQSAHDELVDRSTRDKSLRGLGTTCTALLRSENKLAMVHIGDSRAYLLREGTLVQVTSDHSLVQYLVDTQRISKEEADTHPRRNVVLKILGDTPGPVLADATLREAVVGDRWMLCSDGLSGVVSDDTISQVMQSFSELGACSDELVNLALRAGAPDNVTVVLADVVEVGVDPQQLPEIVGAAAVDRDAPTKGTVGAAGKAAALVKNDDLDSSDTEKVEVGDAKRHKRSKTFWITMVATAFALAAMLGILGASWVWSQRQYYVQEHNGQVVVFQGIPQTLGPMEFSRPLEITDLQLQGLAEVDRMRLEEPVMRSSLEEIDVYLDELRTRLEFPNTVSTGDVFDTDDPQSELISQSGGGK